MTQVRAGDRLTAEDAAFLYFETDKTPLHIGSVSVFEGVVPFEPLVKYVASRLPLIERYRQRLVTPPLNAGHPTWESDPDFDVRNHVLYAQLKRGTEAELRQMAAKLFGRVMDRTRPLWDLTLVHGLKGGRSALIARVHHCLVDGVSGAGLMSVMLSAEGPESRHPRRHERTRPLPGPETSLADALASSYAEAIERVLSAQAATLDILQSLAHGETIEGFAELLRMAPAMLAPVERLPFNRKLAGPRRIAWCDFSLAEVKAIKNACGATVNDVLLTVLAGAIRRYAELHGITVRNRLLHLMVPVNTRTAENDNGYGNRVSMLPVNVPLDARDPMKLLARVHETTVALKNARIADLVSLFATWIGAAPAPVQAILGSMAAVVPLPPFNMVCTNVPGPQSPLYALGHEMLTYHPYLPIGGEMGLGCAIQSYNGRLYIGLTGDVEAAPDLDRIKAFFDESFSELRRAACGAPARRPRKARPAPSPRTVAPVAERMPDAPVPPGSNGVPVPSPVSLMT